MPRCQQCQQEFEISPADLKYYQRIAVPPPVLCFTCSKIKQLNWRNERVFYLRQCDLCRQNMVSCFTAEAKHPVYCNDCWWGDKWNPLNSGQEFDFSRSFFDQFAQLLNKTPLGNLFIATSENSEYTNLCVSNKNCYMVTASDYNDTGAYSSYSSYNRDMVDCTEVKNSELCYDSVDLDRCYQCWWSQNLKGCSHCYFCLNCNGCTDCFGCVNLRNQSNCYLNKQLTKEDYQNKLAGLKLNTHDGYDQAQTMFNQFKVQQIYPFARHLNSSGSTGNYLTNCQNCRNCYNMLDCVDCFNCIHGDKSKDCFESMGVVNSELVYNSVACPVNNNTKFSAIIWPGSSNILYSFLCRTINDCFGCVALHSHRYCILNKQYTEEEYRKLLPKIIDHLKQTGEWGQFFPMAICPWAYNESVGQDLFLLTKEQVLAIGGWWQDRLPGTIDKETIQLTDLNIDIDPDKMTGQILACQKCKRNYKLISQELTFYKRLGIPIPHFCPECRHQQRMALRNPKRLWSRRCWCSQTGHGHQGQCSIEFETTYAPERMEKIYCGECYQKEIY
ncbi:MAG: hypothetical protein WC480_04625 [Patescibacteria group bacterium]